MIAKMTPSRLHLVWRFAFAAIFPGASRMIHVLLFAAALSTSGTGDLCALPDKSEVAPLTGSAEASFKAGRGAEAAESWLRALQLYPVCVTAFPIRKGLVNRALNALEKASAATRPSCTDPVLQTARLVRQMHAEVMPFLRGPGRRDLPRRQ